MIKNKPLFPPSTSSERLEFIPKSIWDQGQKMPALVLAAISPVTPPSTPRATGVAKLCIRLARRNWAAAVTKAPRRPRSDQKRISVGGISGSPLIFPARTKSPINHSWVSAVMMHTRANLDI